MQLEYAEKEDSYLRSKEVCYKILSFSNTESFMFMALYSLSGYFAVTFETHLPDCVDPENIHTPPTKGFCFAPPLPRRNSSFASYSASKILGFRTPSS